MIKTFLLILLGIAVVVVAYSIVCSYSLFKKTLVLEHLVPFERSIKDASFKILVLGDSTAVGTGSEKSEDSTAGRLAARYPEAEVINLAENGLRIKGLEEILATIDENQRYDIVLIQIGANDIIRLTSMDEIEKGINRILKRTESLGEKVIVLHSGDIGESAFFPWYVRPLLSKRNKEVREIYIKAAEAHNASYIDLMDTHGNYASDLLHLTGVGYGMWFEEIAKKL